MKTGRLFLITFLFASFTIIFSSCIDEPEYWTEKSIDLVTTDYINSEPELYSEFAELIEITGISVQLKVRGPFTVFLPDNDAMFEYYSSQGKTSLEDFTEESLEELAYNHIITAKYNANDFGLGALIETNAIGDYIVTEFDNADIIVGKSSKIIDRDIETANGVIHVIDKVLAPVNEDIYNRLSMDQSYSIFTKGLEITNLKDTLEIIQFQYGDTIARTRFTLLAVADTIYNRYGIDDVDDLIAWCGGDPDSITFLNNPFYRYMEYHCLNGSYYLNNLNTGVYPILSRDNNVSFVIDTDYKINVDSDSKAYTGFNIPASNVPAKNGALHSVNDILPAIEPEPATVRFETTDFFDLKLGDYYLSHYGRFFDGENEFEYIKWNGDYMLYYFKDNNGALVNGDCLSMLGWWTMSVTFPKVMKGKYEIWIYQPGWQDVTDCAAYVDGELTPFTYTGPFGTGEGGLQKIAEVNFLETKEHTITLRNTMMGMLFWDYVDFIPVK